MGVMLCAHCQRTPASGSLSVIWEDTLEPVPKGEMGDHPPRIPVCRPCGWKLDGDEAGRDSETARRGVYRYHDPTILPPPPRYTLRGAIHQGEVGAAETMCGLSMVGRRVVWRGEPMPGGICPRCIYEAEKRDGGEEGPTEGTGTGGAAQPAHGEKG